MRSPSVAVNSIDSAVVVDAAAVSDALPPEGLLVCGFAARAG